MIKKSFNLTPAKKAALEKELAELIAERPAIKERIATARSFGDLSENEDYSSARNEQKIAETRIMEIQNILKSAKVIRNVARTKVTLGCSVTISLNKKEVTYSLVDPVEADPLDFKISPASPLGKAIFGKTTGDSFELNGQTGKILAVA